MDKLDQVVLFSIAKMLDLDDLLSFCETSEKFDRLICEQDPIWLFKLNKEFPDWRENFNGESFRKFYSLLVGLSKLKEWMHYQGSIYELLEETAINLSNRNINSLPPEIGSLNNLEGLDLSNNQLQTLPPEIGSLTNLRELWLHKNQIETLAPEIGSLTNLRELSLHNNQIKTLPPEIGSLSNLQELYLYKNQIDTLPPEIGSLTNLQQLYLDKKVKNIPSNLKNVVRYM